MKKTITLKVILTTMFFLLLLSCSMGKGDRRDQNLEQVLLGRLDTIPYVRYVGKSDVRTIDGNRLEAVIIYYVQDSVGNEVERSVRVTSNDDCSEIYSWEELDTEILGQSKQMVSEKFKGKGIDIDGVSLIDALIEFTTGAIKSR
ncbi:MAG: hypothetical protein ACI4TU_03765 [Candidatus Cryptobacteroides sp.]